MAQVEWIKILTAIFEDDKIELIEDMPEGDTLLILWFKLLTLAGKKNDYGRIYLTKGVPYTNEMLSKIFKRPVSMVILALEVFEKYKMTGVDNLGITYIINWEKHQNIEGMARLKFSNVVRKRNQRNRQNLLENMFRGLNTDGSGLCAYCGNHDKLTLDHIIPVTKGGLDVIENYELVCLKCNMSKGNRDLAVYLNELVKEDKKVIQKVINNKKIMTYIGYSDGIFTQRNVRLAVTVTPSHDIEKIREDKNREEKKEKKDKKETAGGSAKKIKMEGKDPLEFSFEDKQWWGLYDWRIKMYQGTFPMLSVNYLFQDLWKTKFLKDPEKYEKMIKEKYQGKIENLVYAWLRQEKKFYLRDHPDYKGG